MKTRFLTLVVILCSCLTASARLANKVEVFFGFLTNPKQAPNFEGGLRLTLD